MRAMRLLGADTLIVTNAAGGLSPTQRAGDLMVIRDHIGLPTMAGANPLRGPNDERLGPRFPPMTAAYDPHLRDIARQVAADTGFTADEGVYAMVAGPNYETPAELRFLRAAGASAVGMSTVPEVIAARHMGMRVLAISCITNVALGADEAEPEAPGHDEVMTVAALAADRLSGLVRGVLRRL
jgi:purine-nucleoside phosphorylase